MSDIPDHLPRDYTAEACADCARFHGCADCFEELVARFQSPVLHFLIRRLHSRHDAEDVLQEVFITAYRKLDRYQSAWRFSTWLFTIAHRLAISHYRSKSRTNTHDEHIVQRVDVNDPSTIAQSNDLRGSLWNAAQAMLEPDAFTALWLGYVEDMSADQIGLVLARNANAVRVLQHRARMLLANRLGPAWRELGVS